jgi:hypothetical protein
MSANSTNPFVTEGPLHVFLIENEPASVKQEKRRIEKIATHDSGLCATMKRKSLLCVHA